MVSILTRSQFVSGRCECYDTITFQVPLPVDRYPGRLMKYGVISTARLEKVILIAGPSVYLHDKVEHLGFARMVRPLRGRAFAQASANFAI